MKNRIDVLQFKIQNEIQLCARPTYDGGSEVSMARILDLMLELAECVRNIELGVSNLTP